MADNQVIGKLGYMSSGSEETRVLFARIAECLPSAVQLKEVAFRSAAVRYANETDLVTGDGASCRVGRWNPRGIRAIYFSLDPTTAVAESFQEFLKYGFKATNIRPRVIVGAKLNLRQVLDLTGKDIRRQLGFRLAELVEEDWHAIQSAGEESWTQTIGRGAWLAGFEGLLVPSASKAAGKNIVIYPDKLTRASIELLGKDELPPHPAHRTQK